MYKYTMRAIMILINTIFICTRFCNIIFENNKTIRTETLAVNLYQNSHNEFFKMKYFN